MNRNIFLLILLFIITGCGSKRDFRNEIVQRYQKGTSFTMQWWLNSADDSSKVVENFNDINKNDTVFYMVTSTGGNTHIETNFEYDRRYKPIRITRIDNYFFTDSNVVNNYGHLFEFSINEYAWRVGRDRYASYICHFDNLGNILDEQGTISVDQYKYTDVKKMELFFTTVFHKIDSIRVSSPKSSVKTYNTKPHAWLPMMDYISIDYSIDSVFYIDIITTHLNSEVKQIYYDTVFVK